MLLIVNQAFLFIPLISWKIKRHLRRSSDRTWLSWPLHEIWLWDGYSSILVDCFKQHKMLYGMFGMFVYLQHIRNLNHQVLEDSQKHLTWQKYTKQFLKMWWNFLLALITSMEVRFHKPRVLFLLVFCISWDCERSQVMSSCIDCLVAAFVILKVTEDIYLREWEN
jgi:hypothetical protein